MRPYLRFINFIGLIVPRHLRLDWRQEWEAELRYREVQLAEWDKLNWRSKLDLLWRSLGAFVDALALTLVTTLIFGLIPALQISKVKLHDEPVI